MKFISSAMANVEADMVSKFEAGQAKIEDLVLYIHCIFERYLTTHINLEGRLFT